VSKRKSPREIKEDRQARARAALDRRLLRIVTEYRCRLPADEIADALRDALSRVETKVRYRKEYWPGCGGPIQAARDVLYKYSPRDLWCVRASQEAAANLPRIEDMLADDDDFLPPRRHAPDEDFAP
jgi:hypothetical protein